MKGPYRTGDQTWVRERNLAVLLHYLWEAGGPISRARLTDISGLNKSTVGSLLRQLESWDLVHETGLSNSRLGRPGIVLDMNPNGGRIIGVEISVGNLTVIVTDLKANVLWRRQINDAEFIRTNSDQAQTLARAEQVIEQALCDPVIKKSRLLGIGVSVPGLVNQRTGILLFAPNLHWHNVPLRDLWQERFGVPVMVENDANAGALGEQMFGVARQVDNFVYLSANIGLGGGLVIDGKLYGGAGGYAGEIGHMTLEPEGPLCNCGNHGCWETLVGPLAMVHRVRQAAIEGRAPGLLAALDDSVEALQLEHVLAAAGDGVPAVLESLDQAGQYLGIGIANLVNVLNPRMVVLGGILSLVGPYILPRAQQEVNARVLDTLRAQVEIKTSDFKLDSIVMGNISLIIRQILMNPLAWYSPYPHRPAIEDRIQPATFL